MPKFQLIQILGDGNCLFRAVSTFLSKNQDTHQNLRIKAVEYIDKNWNELSLYVQNNSFHGKKDYCNKMLQSGCFGTSLECLALAETYKINFLVYFQPQNLKIDNVIHLSKSSPYLQLNKNLYKTSINLLFSGKSDSGHFNLLIPLQENIQEKIYCSICNRSFKNNVGLKIHHSRIHLDCQSQVSQSSDISITTNSSKLKCNLCEHFFKGERGLNKHKKIKHKLEYNSNTNENFDSDYLNQLLINLKECTPILKRIPKGARACVAKELTTILNRIVQENDLETWMHLFCFSFLVLKLPKKSKHNKNKCLTSLVKENLKLWTEKKNLNLQEFIQFFNTKSDQKETRLKSNKNPQKNLGKKVESKISEGDIKGAIQILTSSETLATKNEETIKILEYKHPPHEKEMCFPSSPEEILKINFLNLEIKKSISSFRPGSAGGIDGLRPQHLKDLVSENLGTFSSNLLSAISSFINHVHNASVPLCVSPIFFGASLCAFNKKDGGIRPIAVGMTMRRLSAKLICSKMYDKLGTLFRPTQLGFGTNSGAEAICHAIRRYVTFPHDSEKVLIKIDFYNAFNMVNRDTILDRVKQYIPEFYNFIHQCYKNESFLSFGNNLILSKRGVQQGDPLGPPLFCLVILPIILKLKSEINVWYLDDGTIAGSPELVFEDFEFIEKECSKVGLNVNYKKCEFSILSNNSTVKSKIFSKFKSLTSQFSTINLENLNLLGCPLSNFEIEKCLNKKIDIFNTFSKNILLLNSHVAFFLLKHSFSIPRITYLLRCAPCWRVPHCLENFDLCLKSCLENIVNCTFNEFSWQQCVLPVSMGGLGIRNSKKLCFPAFLSSVKNTSALLSRMLPSSIFYSKDSAILEAEQNFHDLTDIADFSNFNNQKDFDRGMCQVFFNRILSQTNDKRQKARLLALQEPESNAWLKALPSVSLGNVLDDPSFRISVGLRLGMPVVGEHTCAGCSKKVDIYGLHGLCCNKSVGRLSRHGQINDIIMRSLRSANIPSVLEPNGVCRADGKRVDGMSLVPWKAGRPLLWDATCRDTMAESYIDRTASRAGSAAELGEKVKQKKYEELSQQFIFVPFSVETFGPWGSESKRLMKEISLKIKNKNAHSYLIQKISLAIQRGNSASVLSTLPVGTDLEEIFYL